MKMEKYLSQLMGDIEVLITSAPPNPANIRTERYLTEEDFEYMMLEVQDHLEGERGALIPELTGICKEGLPRAEQLSEHQLKELHLSLIDLLRHYRIYPEFPVKMPMEIAYDLIRDKWEELRAPMVDFNFHYDFCSGDCSVCAVKDYCEVANSTEFEGKKEDGLLWGGAGITLGPDEEQQDLGEIIGRLQALPSNRFIVGIANYCDRWCERCAYAASCTAFYLGSDVGVGIRQEPYDRNWIDEVEGSYESIIAMVLREKQSLHIDAVELSRNEGFNISLKDDLLCRPESRELLTIAEYYAKSLGEWCKATGDERVEKVIGNRSVYQTIVYFQTSIPVKLFRALIGEDPDEVDHPVQNDGNGSAKAVMGMIRESLRAWAWILMKKEEMKNIALKQVILLEEILRGLQEKFPRAEEFIRPGFDEEKSEWRFE